jgi:cytochrome P450
MAWVLYVLSQHPEVEEKVTAELAEAGLLACSGYPNPRPVQWDDLKRLRYLEAVINVLHKPLSSLTQRILRSFGFLFSSH